MINVGFYEGDYLIIEKAAQADNGEIVVALIDDSVTVKRFFSKKTDTLGYSLRMT